MTKIDRYLLVIYFRVLAICFLSISGLVVIVQTFTNLTEFIELGQRGGGLARVLIGYFGPYILTLFDKLSGLLALMALMFAVSWITRTNELTALLAAGVTKRRVMRPLMIASAGVIAMAAISREIWIPQFQHSLERPPQDLLNDVLKSVRAVNDRSLGIYLQALKLSPSNQELIEPFVRIHPGPLTKLGRQLMASNGKYMPATDQRPAGYRLTNVTKPHSIDSIDSIYDIQGKPLLLTRKDCSWLEPGECFLVTSIEFDMLRGGTKRFASTSELIHYLQRGDAPMVDEVRVHIHSRFVRPAIDWTVLLLGIPIVLTQASRHVFWVAGVCLLMVGGFTIVVMALSAAGGAGYIFSPLVAVWLPLLTVLPWAYQKTAAAMDS